VRGGQRCGLARSEDHRVAGVRGGHELETASGREEDPRAQGSRRARRVRVAACVRQHDARVALRLVPLQVADVYARAEVQLKDPSHVALVDVRAGESLVADQVGAAAAQRGRDEQTRGVLTEREIGRTGGVPFLCAGTGSGTACRAGGRPGPPAMSASWTAADGCGRRLLCWGPLGVNERLRVMLSMMGFPTRAAACRRA
jgi:hypothetical protein